MSEIYLEKCCFSLQVVTNINNIINNPDKVMMRHIQRWPEETIWQSKASYQGGQSLT